MISARLLAVTAAIVVALVVSVWLRPTQVDGMPLRLNEAIPSQLGEWQVDPTVVPIAPTPDVQAQLDRIYDQLVARTYVNTRTGERVMLAVAYGGVQTDAIRAHRQEACYRAQGFTVRNLRHTVVDLLGRQVRVVRLHAEQGSRSEPVTYWMTMGDRVVWGRDERMAAQIAYGIQGRVVSGFLVRVSSLTLDPARGFELHDEFLSTLLQVVDPELRPKLIGRAVAPT